MPEGWPQRHNINLQRKCPKPSLSEAEAKQIFGNEEISCTHFNCGWSGKACNTKLLRILPFNYGIFSHNVATETRVISPLYQRIKLVRAAALMVWGEAVFQPCLISLRIVRRFARIVFIHAKGPSCGK